MTSDSLAAAVRGKMIRPGDAGGAAGLTQVGAYRRVLGGSVERLLENALDWEHLPWLHDSSFRWIKKEEAGGWGWRGKIGLPSTEEPQEIRLELLLDRETRSWVSRIIEGPGTGNEIWSHTDPVDDEHCEVFVEFHLAIKDPEHADAYGKAYERLYARLYDEDESMMVGRQEQLARVREAKSKATEPLVLGHVDEVKAALPLNFEYGGNPFRLIAWEGGFLAHSTVCPHFLGPLEHCEVKDGGIVTCPWHGCLFDVVTGKSADQNTYCLETPPIVFVDESTSKVWVRGEASG